MYGGFLKLSELNWFVVEFCSFWDVEEKNILLFLLGLVLNIFIG